MGLPACGLRLYLVAMPSNLQFRELVTPLALASYLAWIAVWFSASHLLGVSPGGAWLADVFMITFLVSWLWFLATENRTADWILNVQLVVLAVCALGLIGLGRSGSSPILLVLLVSQFATRFPRPQTISLFVLINLVFLALMLFRWNLSPYSAMISLAAYGAFQLFALLVLCYADEAESMANELRLVNADLVATRSLLGESARDQERLRLSRELHDVAGHKLTALRMNLRALKARPELGQSRELTQSDELAAELLDDLRAVVRQLRKGDGLSLEEGFRALALPMANLGLEVDIEPAVRVQRVEQAEVLLSVVQEGLTNAARHGRARKAWLRLRRIDDALVLQLDDDGQLDWPIEEGMGLNGMRERLESLDGGLELAPSEHGGLRIRASLPLEPQP